MSLGMGADVTCFVGYLCGAVFREVLIVLIQLKSPSEHDLSHLLHK